MRNRRSRGINLAMVWGVVSILFVGLAGGQTTTISTLNTAEDLDLSGTIICAVNFGDNGSPVVGGVCFAQNESVSDVTLDAEGEGPATVWGPSPSTGDDGLNDLLVGLAYRLEPMPTVIRVNVNGLTTGMAYVLQLIAYEMAEEDRGIDIFIENEEIFSDLDGYTAQGSVLGQGGVLMRYEFVAGDSTLNIRIMSEDNACAMSGLLLSQPRPSVVAFDPDPVDEATEVPADVPLGWASGQYAVGHDVYLGTSEAEVEAANRGNPMGLLVSENQEANVYGPPEPLAWNQTYYWRVDEVNAAPDNTIIEGDVWSFTVEPQAYPVENIMATSDAASAADEGPENTVNGSGLNADDEHSIASQDTWLTTMGADPVSIQFEFDRLYKLHEMWVWNCNVEFELIIGAGLKDVTVSYSADGANWSHLADVEFAQATETTDYTANTVVDLEGIAARYVRLTANSSWGMRGQIGLSEVRFLYIPVQATRPTPSVGATQVAPDSVLNWRAGREAAQHEVCLGTDQATVLDGTALVATVDDSCYVPDELAFGRTYYWKVNEVNEAAAVASWEGDLWSFSTCQFVVLDDFEQYSDENDLIYETWIDGWYNGTGSVVGYIEAPFAEQIIVHDGGQSMPLEYNNDVSPYYSEAGQDSAGVDWSAHGADTLRLYVRGDSDNEAVDLYVAVEDATGQSASVTHTDSQIALSTEWQEWLIPLAEFAGVDFSSVQTMYIGLGDRSSPSCGGCGLIFIDDIAIGHFAQTN